MRKLFILPLFVILMAVAFLFQDAQVSASSGNFSKTSQIPSQAPANNTKSTFFTITTIPSSMKDSIPEGTTSPMSLLVQVNGTTNVTAGITDLVPQNLQNATNIPVSLATVNQTLKLNKTRPGTLIYTVTVPKNQTSGTYNGTLLLLANDDKSTSIRIPIQVTVHASSNPYIVFYAILLGTLTSVGWTALNDYKKALDNVTLPQSPTNLGGKALSQSEIYLSWNSSDKGGTPAGYRIEKSSDNGNTWSTIIVPNANSLYTSYVDSSLTASTTYTYRVSAINQAGTSEPSSNFAIKTLDSDGPSKSDEFSKLDAENSKVSKKLLQGPRERAIFRGFVTGIGAVMAGVITFNQFLPANPGLADQVFGGVLIAFAWGFGSHQIIDNVIDEGSKTLNKTS